MDAQTNVADPATEEHGNEASTVIRERIIHTLRVFPKLSPSMLNVGIGTSVPGSLWRPELERLKAEGIVIEDTVVMETPARRTQSYTVLSLSPEYQS